MMARLEPFAAIRYDPARVDPDDVVSPPYDVVGPAERAPSLPRGVPTTPSTSTSPSRPGSAGSTSTRTLPGPSAAGSRAAIVGRDAVPRPSTSTDDLPRRARTPSDDDGLLGALGLDLDGSGQVLPHEQTMPKDRLDRLSLLRSTRLTPPRSGCSPWPKGSPRSVGRRSHGRRGKQPWRRPTRRESSTRPGPSPSSGTSPDRPALRRGSRADRGRPSPLRDGRDLCPRVP